MGVREEGGREGVDVWEGGCVDVSCIYEMVSQGVREGVGVSGCHVCVCTYALHYHNT